MSGGARWGHPEDSGDAAALRAALPSPASGSQEAQYRAGSHQGRWRYSLAQTHVKSQMTPGTGQVE